MSMIDTLSEAGSTDDEDYDQEHHYYGELPSTNTHDQRLDFLPQPYRMIDEVVQYIVNRALFTCVGKRGSAGDVENEHLSILDLVPLAYSPQPKKRVRNAGNYGEPRTHGTGQER